MALNFKMSTKSKKYLLFFLPFFFLGLFFRIYKIDSIPGGIDVDEAAFGFNAYSILKTAKDEWGEFLPLDAFLSFGDYKLPLFFYLLIPGITLFGLKITVIRLTSVFLGALTIFLLLLLAKNLKKFIKDNENGFVIVPVLSAILLSISPWHMVMSRKGTEQVCSLLVLTIASLFFLKYLKKTTAKNLVLFTLFFIFSCASYYSSRAFSLIFFPSAFFLFLTSSLKAVGLKTYINKQTLRFYVSLLVVFLYVFFTSKSTGGLIKVWQNSPFGPFNRQGIVNRINEHRSSCAGILPPVLCQFIYNKPLTFTKIYLKNYLAHYNLLFFFTHGYSGSDRSFMSNQPPFYLIEIIFLVIGLVRVCRLKGFAKRFLLLWFFLFPIPDSMTGTFTSRRILIGLPVLIIINALGLAFLINLFKKNLKKRFFLALYSFSFLIALFSLTSLFFDYKKFTEFESRYWGYADKKVLEYLKMVDKNFEKVCFSTTNTSLYSLYLFIHRVDPDYFHKNVEHFLREDEVALEWTETPKVGKYYFVSDCKVEESGNLKNTLIIYDEGRLGVFPQRFRNFYERLESFYDQNNELVYEVYALKE